MELLRLVGKRTVQLLAVLLAVSFFTFVLIHLLPGDVTQVIIPFGTPEQKARLAADLGLKDGYFTQYWNYLTGLFSGDLGHQYSTGRPVSQLVEQSLPVSIQLMVYAQIIALLFAIPLGVLAAYRSGTRTDRVINTSSFGLLALPNFVLALLLSYIIGAELKLLPTGGYAPGLLDQVFDSSRSPDFGSPADWFSQAPNHFNYMLLPAISLAVGQIAIYMRLLRSDMVATLQENFITMAKAKGISNKRLLWRHALRPSSLTLLTVAGLNVGTLIGGAIVVEVIFQIPGMGLKIGQAIFSREFVELQSYIIVIAALFVILNFFIDFLYAVLDPRIRRARAAA